MTFEVVAEDLTAHASHLDGLSDRMATAVSAAQEVSMSDEAYGLLCSFLPPIINPMEKDGLDALKAAQEGITATADNVRDSAKQYTETDQAGADSLKPFDDAVRVDEGAVQLRGVEPGNVPQGGQSERVSANGAQNVSRSEAMPRSEELQPNAVSEPRRMTVSEGLEPTEPEPRQMAASERLQPNAVSEPRQAVRDPRGMGE